MESREKGRTEADGRRRREAKPQRPENQEAEKGRPASARAMAEGQRPGDKVSRRLGDALGIRDGRSFQDRNCHVVRKDQGGTKNDDDLGAKHEIKHVQNPALTVGEHVTKLYKNR